jgi:GT2 family glycosyltransferase
VNRAVSESPPRFSVVIPTHRRSIQLTRCLEAITRLEFPADLLEVIVVDDGGTLELPPGAGATLEHFEVLRRRQAGPAAARNAGAAAAAGEWLAFVDDDCEPDARWLTALADALGSSHRDAVAGRVVNAFPRDVYAGATQQLLDYAREWYVANDPSRRYATSNNLAVAREEFLDVGGFDARFVLAAGEDREFSSRWLASGRGIVDAPDALVRHAHRLSLPSYLRQHFNYGRGAFTFHGTTLAAPGGRFAARRFYAGLLVTPLRSESQSKLRGATTSGLLLASQVATAAGYLWEAGSARRKPTGGSHP